jgi:RNA recognition motif-containing protein
MARLIQVGNLSNSVDNLDLLHLFETHGAVRSAMISKHLETGRSTGFGLVEMESENAGAAAIAALNRQEHFGRVLSVWWNDIINERVADREQIFGPMNMTNEGPAEKETGGK